MATEARQYRVHRFRCIKRIAEAARQVNETTENIGASAVRIPYCCLCKEISYNAVARSHGQNITIDAEYVSKHLDALVADEDLPFIL